LSASSAANTLPAPILTAASASLRPPRPAMAGAAYPARARCGAVRWSEGECGDGGRG
jgi:hypothetical protein